jgi:PIN domain nuclease of toxin-antitoxin system
VAFLLDTHILLWMLVSPEKLSPAMRKLFKAVNVRLYISNASLWEISIKYERGKLQLPMPPLRLFPPYLQEADLVELPVLSQHALQVSALAPIHRDPFDRLLIAQAMVNELTVVTVDPVFARYDIAVFSS